MKRISLAAVLLYAGNLVAQNRSIVFENASLKESIAKAKAENKLVFVDCYTTWCGPCKAMAAQVFTQDSVADFFNARFVNVKLDMEKGEGPQIGAKYHVEAYPTYLLLNSEGDLLYRFVGGMASDKFLAKTRQGMSPSNRMARIMQQYDAGDRSKEVLRDYIRIKLDGMEISVGTKLANEYFDMLTPSERVQPENWFLFGENKYSRYISGLHSRTFNYLADHWKDFAKTNSTEAVASKLRNMYLQIAGACLRGWYFKDRNNKTYTYDKKEFDRFRSQIRSTRLPDKKQLIILMNIAQAAAEKNTDKVTRLLAKHIASFSAGNQAIGFDYLFMPGIDKKDPHFREVMEAIIRSNKNENLVRAAGYYKK